MGRFDSSVTRVAPVFGQLLMRDASGESWLGALLDSAEHPRRRPTRPDLGELVRTAWSPAEHLLDAPRSLLEHLVMNPPVGLASEGAERARLAAGDPEVVEEALRLLRESAALPAKAWYLLESKTHIDAYLETATAVIVVEGKRTERRPTTATKWMPLRYQMLRAIDAVWDTRRDRHVYGLYIVEGTESGVLSAEWTRFVADTASPNVLAGSLPHRSDADRSAMGDAFLGATTWQRVCGRLDLRFDLLPDEVTLMRDRRREL